MGYSSYSSKAYDDLRSTYSSKSTDDIFVNNRTRKIDPLMDPRNLKLRECRDSSAHPLSLAIQLWLDETGSMGEIPEYLIKNKLGALIEILMKHGVTDPAVLFGGIGDQFSDDYPCQVGQFESGTDELNKWLTSLFLEGRGGGQDTESYLLAWYVAGRHTSIDCFEKRNKKGYLFTVGDEATWQSLSPTEIKSIFGVVSSEPISAKQLLDEASRMYNVFHIHVNSTGHRNDHSVINSWKNLLGERLIILEDPDMLAETIASTISIIEGADKSTVLTSIGSSIVTNALVNISSNKDIDQVKVIKF